VGLLLDKLVWFCSTLLAWRPHTCTLKGLTCTPKRQTTDTIVEGLQLQSHNFQKRLMQLLVLSRQPLNMFCGAQLRAQHEDRQA